MYWLSGQIRERSPCDTFNGIRHFGAKHAHLSLKVLLNFSECILECLKAYVEPESTKIVLNARGYGGHLFGVSQKGLKQTQRAAEKLTILTLQEAKKLESNVDAVSRTAGLEGSNVPGDEETSDSDEELVMLRSFFPQPGVCDH